MWRCHGRRLFVLQIVILVSSLDDKIMLLNKKREEVIPVCPPFVCPLLHGSGIVPAMGLLSVSVPRRCCMRMADYSGSHAVAWSQGAIVGLYFFTLDRSFPSNGRSQHCPMTPETITVCECCAVVCLICSPAVDWLLVQDCGSVYW